MLLCPSAVLTKGSLYRAALPPTAMLWMIDQLEQHVERGLGVQESVNSGPLETLKDS